MGSEADNQKDEIMAENIRDKVVVITGASSGLGEAAARLLAREGTKLVLGARRLDRLQALAGALLLGEGAILQTDVTDVGQSGIWSTMRSRRTAASTS